LLTPQTQPRGHEAAAQPIIDLTQSDAATSATIDGCFLDEYDADNDSDWVTTDSDSSCYSDHDDDNENSPGARPLPSGTLRRSVPLSTLRERLATSTGTGSHAQDGPAAETQHLEHSQYSADTMSYLPDEFYDSNMFRSMEAVAQVASQIPLPAVAFEEELVFYVAELMAGVGVGRREEEGEGHLFGSQPPHVPGGIALREEAEEAGLADIVTKV